MRTMWSMKVPKPKRVIALSEGASERDIIFLCEFQKKTAMQIVKRTAVLAYIITHLSFPNVFVLVAIIVFDMF